MRGTKDFRAAAFAGCMVLAFGACNDDEDTLATSGDAGADAAVAADTGVHMDASSTPLDSSVVDATTKPDSSQPTANNAEKLKHLIVIYQENHSFDNLYGTWEGAEGLSAASAAQKTQLDLTGTAFTTLAQTDPHVPTTLENAPFDITKYVPANQKTVDLVHRFYQEQRQINGGKMNQFATVSDAKGLSMGYFPTEQVPLATKLKTIPNQVRVFDHFFHAAFGGSFLNHIWLIAGQSPVFPNAPASVVSVLGPDGYPTSDNQVTPDGFAVNTTQTVNHPHSASTDMTPEKLMPLQTFATIGDRLIDKNIDFAWYAGGWDIALAGDAANAQNFQYHHQPFNYFKTFADGSPAKAAHLKDETAFLAAVQAGTLPPVSFVKPVGAQNEHPGYADLITGENHAVDLVNAVMASSIWKDTAIIITYDENGGQWDHVAPPATDKWGPGTRVPAILISPFAKPGVDKTIYDTTAILKLIEERWGTAPLNMRVTNQASILSNAFDFSK